MSKSLRCFISAPVSTNTAVLKMILKEQGVIVSDSYDFNIGDPIHNIVAEKLKEADFVISIIYEDNPNVFYEFGLSEGMKKPIFVIVGKDTKPPYFIQKHIYLRTVLEDKEVLRLSLSKFVEGLQKPTRKVKSNNQKATITLQNAGEYLSKISELRQRGSGQQFEFTARKFFENLNLQFVINDSSAPDTGIDFALWSDNLDLSIGNSLLVECKFGNLSKTQIERAENQLKSYISKSDSRAAILLYLDRNGRRFSQNHSAAPLIIRYDFEDFVRDISNSSLEDSILAKRNNIVHGVGD